MRQEVNYSDDVAAWSAGLRTAQARHRRRRSVLLVLACLCSVAFGSLGAMEAEEPEHSRARLAEDTLPPRCDPTRVISPDACSKCHVQESQVWRSTPHAQLYERLQRDPRAQDIARRMGVRSIKRNDLCARCHFTQVETSGKLRAIAGVSCESCHGAGRDWVNVHNDYGGPSVSREQEPEAHRIDRLRRSMELGMRNPENIYLIARSCLECHTVPNESLVNQGGHHAGSQGFELVAWSQGSVRHKFLTSSGQFNAPSTPEHLRVMYVAGILAEMEFSLRATAVATQANRFGHESAQRAVRAALRLKQVQDDVQQPLLHKALVAFAHAELRTNNFQQLNAVADELREVGIRFGEADLGTELSAVDRYLPPANAYR